MHRHTPIADLSEEQKLNETLLVLWRNLQLDEIETVVVFLEKMSTEELKTRVVAFTLLFDAGAKTFNRAMNMRRGKQEQGKKTKTERNGKKRLEEEVK